MHWLCDRWAFVWNLRLTTNMTSSVTRRVVRTGGSCLVKRIVVLGDEPVRSAAAAAAAFCSWSTVASERL